ncbi:MAG: hypothetical protein KBE94_04510, partial [Paludibacteraceae bacterium]|nr:hypothetical protein [Paludibacteraceae bacterium]
MKKLITTIFVTSIACWGLFAQGTNFARSEGNVTVDVNFRPGVNAPLALNLIQGRYFLNETTAIRTGINLTIDSKTNKKTKPGAGNGGSVLTEDFLNRTIAFTLNPGIEKHYPITDRLSTYIGGDILFTYKTDYALYENSNSIKTETKNATGSTTYGAQFVAGFDIAIFKGLYLGAELNYGATWT